MPHTELSQGDLMHHYTHTHTHPSLDTQLPLHLICHSFGSAERIEHIVEKTYDDAVAQLAAGSPSSDSGAAGGPQGSHGANRPRHLIIVVRLVDAPPVDLSCSLRCRLQHEWWLIFPSCLTISSPTICFFPLIADFRSGERGRPSISPT